MDAKTMLDKAVKIIARQDVDRSLLLFFMNTVRRAILGNYDIRKFYKYKAVSHENGIISDISIKHAKTVEYINGTKVITLVKLRDYEHARELYPDLTKTGDPVHYLEMGTEIWLLPVPTDTSYITVFNVDSGTFDETTSGVDFGTFTDSDSLVYGTVNIYGEFWPADLTDSTSSNDVTTVEIPEALIYLAAAEYLDYFDETGKGAYWRDKGKFVIDEYATQSHTQYHYNLDNAVDEYFHIRHVRGDYK